MLAIDAGRSARFLSCAQLVFDLKAAKERGRLDERYQELSKVDLLILDEFGYIPLDSDGGCSYSFVNWFFQLTGREKAMLTQAPRGACSLVGSARLARPRRGPCPS